MIATTPILVIGGERILILAEFDNEERATSGLGLIYINEAGDSLDGCYLHPDTVDTPSPGPLLQRPDGKVMMWVFGAWRMGSHDILYTFYPDGGPIPPEPPDTTEVVDNGLEVHPTEFGIVGAYPNPFNSRTAISFSTGMETGATRLAVYDLAGRLVEEMEEGKWKREKGNMVSVTWDASGVGAGVYIVRLEGGGKVAAMKVVLVR